MKKRHWFASGVLISGVALWLINSPRFAAPSVSDPRLSAHRGVHQSFDVTGVENDTCTAARIDPPTHDYLENTLRSIAAAIGYGADIVEIDVHPTTDGEFVVTIGHWTAAQMVPGAFGIRVRRR